MTSTRKAWSLLVVFLLLAGWIVWPVVADSPSRIRPVGAMEDVTSDRLRIVDVDIHPLSEATLAPSRAILVKFEGAITARPSVKAGTWLIGGKSVLVTPDTLVLPWGYVPKVGDPVVVNAVRTSTSLTATRLEVPKPGQQDLHPVEFRGVISHCVALAPYWGDWIIGETRVTVHSSTTVEGVPYEGLYAQVRGVVTRDGQVGAYHIRVLDPAKTAAEFQFKAMVHSMPSGGGAGVWVIGGVSGDVDADTVIESADKIQVGSLVEVSGGRYKGNTVRFGRIALVTDSAQVSVEGLIEKVDLMSDGEWVVGGTAVLVDEATFVDESHGRAQLGMWASVAATEMDGVYRALRIRIEQP